MTLLFFSLTILFLLGLFFLSALISALRRLHKRDSRKIFRALGNLFFYRYIFKRFYPKDDYEGILFSALVSQNIARLFVIGCSTLFLFFLGTFDLILPLFFLVLILYVLFIFIFSDYIPRILGSKYPTRMLPLSCVISQPFLIISFPFTFLFLTLSHAWKNLFFDYMNEPIGDIKHEIFEILQEADISPKLSSDDRKLIESVVRFQSRIAREVMVPRINIFSLKAETSIQEAGKRLHDEGYSRVPVYKDTIDQIVGVLMYKDILTKYMEYQKKGNDKTVLDAPIESIVKNVMYTPETKKISNLLQEFRKKQTHLAIVVDEYGGTAGLVTIEDILEEIVGKIEDEYDEESEMISPLHDGSWIADARMTIIDAEEQLGIHIPQEGDYDTIGGYIFHRAGSIPSKGFTIKLDDVELEVLKSNDRRVEKVKIKKIPKIQEI